MENSAVSVKNINCPICRNGGGIVRIIHYGVRDRKDIDVFECSTCGIKFLSNTVPGDYESGFIFQVDNLQDKSIEWLIDDVKEDDERRFQMLKDNGKGKKWLDFGCGFGGFMSRMKEVGADCYGVELGLREKNYLSEIGITCKKSIEDYDIKFDTISLFHVFEHLDNPRDYLHKIGRALKPGGELIIEVPNANDVLLSVYECDAFADFTYWSPHIILYNENTLKMLLEETEMFEPISLGFYQRYPLSNHLMWLAKGKPGGQDEWKWANNDVLTKAYADVLARNKLSDTIFQVWRRK